MVGRIRPAGAPAVKSARHNFASGTKEPSLANVRHSRLQARQAARLSDSTELVEVSPKSSTANREPRENRPALPAHPLGVKSAKHVQGRARPTLGRVFRNQLAMAGVQPDRYDESYDIT